MSGDVPVLPEYQKHMKQWFTVGSMQIEKLADVTIYPDFIREQIYHLDTVPQHFVTRA